MVRGEERLKHCISLGESPTNFSGAGKFPLQGNDNYTHYTEEEGEAQGGETFLGYPRVSGRKPKTET